MLVDDFPFSILQIMLNFECKRKTEKNTDFHYPNITFNFNCNKFTFWSVLHSFIHKINCLISRFMEHVMNQRCLMILLTIDLTAYFQQINGPQHCINNKFTNSFPVQCLLNMVSGMCMCVCASEYCKNNDNFQTRNESQNTNL